MERAAEPLSTALKRLDARQREEAQLRASHQLLTSTLDAASDGILTLQFDEDHVSMFYNIRFVELWGIPEDTLDQLDLVKLSDHQLRLVKDPQAWWASVTRRSRYPEEEQRGLLELKDGRVFERHVIPHRIHGRIAGSVTTFRDVTDRCESERRMRQNQQVLENAGPMLFIDRDTAAVTYANVAACSHFGWDRHELVGKSIHDLDPRFTPAERLLLDEALASASAPVHF